MELAMLGKTWQTATESLSLTINQAGSAHMIQMRKMWIVRPGRITKPDTVKKEKFLRRRAVLGISLRKVTYEAFIFSVFSRNQEKTKPLTWWSVSSKALQSL